MLIAACSFHRSLRSWEIKISLHSPIVLFFQHFSNSWRQQQQQKISHTSFVLLLFSFAFFCCLNDASYYKDFFFNCKKLFFIWNSSMRFYNFSLIWFIMFGGFFSLHSHLFFILYVALYIGRREHLNRSVTMKIMLFLLIMDIDWVIFIFVRAIEKNILLFLSSDY